MCSRGEGVRDQTDYLPYKAHIIGDKDREKFFEIIDEAITSEERGKEQLIWEVFRADPSRTAWECETCGRLYFENSEGGFVEYLPDNGRVNKVFDRQT